MKPEKIVSFDIETLSVNKNAAVLSFGFVVVDITKDQSFDELIENGVEFLFDTSLQVNRHVSQSTRQWWSEQGAEAQRVLEPGAAARDHRKIFTLIEEAGFNPAELSTFNWYARGPGFDQAILESLWEMDGISPPWKFYKMRDIRTWLECHGLADNTKLKKPPGMIHHNAMHDAAFDAWMMLQVLHKKPLELDISKKPALTLDAMRAIGAGK